MTVAEAPTRRRERPAPLQRTVERRSQDGTVLGTVMLDPETFGIEPHVAVLHQVVTAQLAAARAGTQSTKTRAEVAGGGAKPFRQKGTGRARQGSTRSPQWSGGGVALGPKPRSYRQRTPKKMIRLALRSALSDRAAEGRVALIDHWDFPEPRTKEAVAALEALGLDGRVLVVLGEDDHTAGRSFGNLPRVQLCGVEELNAYDILRNDWVVFTDATLPGPAVAGAEEIAGADEAGALAGDESVVAGAGAAGRSDAVAADAEDTTGIEEIAGADEAGALAGEAGDDEDEGSRS